jgi:hypothetical protein
MQKIVCWSPSKQQLGGSRRMGALSGSSQWHLWVHRALCLPESSWGRAGVAASERAKSSASDPSASWGCKVQSTRYVCVCYSWSSCPLVTKQQSGASWPPREQKRRPLVNILLPRPLPATLPSTALGWTLCSRRRTCFIALFVSHLDPWDPDWPSLMVLSGWAFLFSPRPLFLLLYLCLFIE